MSWYLPRPRVLTRPPEARTVFYRVDPGNPQVRLVPVQPAAALVSNFASVGYILYGHPAWALTAAAARIGAMALTRRPSERALLRR